MRGAGRISCSWPSGWEPEGGPCAPWPIELTCLPGWPCEVEDFEPRHWIALAIASERLWRATGGRYGICREYVRPCRRGCDGWNRVFTGTWGLEGPQGGMSGRWGNSWLAGFPGGGALMPANLGGTWINLSCGSCRGDCSCVELCEILLPGPVACVIEVKWNGVVVDPRTYTLLPPNRLVRRGVSSGCGCDGCGGPSGCACQPCWPKCQRLDLPDCEPCTFSVLFERGLPVPPGGVLAVSRLAYKIAESCGGDAADCPVPFNATQVTREGITYQLQAPTFDAGEPFMTGIPEVDEWVALVNPHGLKQPSAVFSPDFPAAPPSWRVGRPGFGGGAYGW